MTPDKFIANWKQSSLNEDQGAKPHFFELCELLDVPKPSGNSLKDHGYGFEVNVDKVGGGIGFADVWKQGCFAWEYKSPGRDLNAALRQLKLYASDLENPPLLIVSDMRRIELHTNWTNMVQEKHVIELDELTDPRQRQKLKWAFDAESVTELRPKRSANATTEEVARKFVQIAQNLREQGHDPEKVAHFVNRMVFCMFAEDVDLLPRKLFEQMLRASLDQPAQFVRNAEALFKAMAERDGMVGFTAIDWFNGGLFEDGTALPLSESDIRIALEAAQQNWSEINPSIMGTLFERGLDPSKRSQLGAHYTDAEKIMMIIRPVIIEPLLRDWAEVRAQIEAKLAAAKGKAKQTQTKVLNDAQALRVEFVERLKNFRILDPACGSGNFLYLALKAVKDIEFRVNFEAEGLGLPPGFPSVGPECVRGIEINPFAAELARVSVWIGEIQWMREKNFGVSKNPILKPLETIECRDALLNPDGTEAEWPEADVIIGNPPFLGSQRMLESLGGPYVSRVRPIFEARLGGGVDFVCYWFDKAWRQITRRRSSSAGFVATNSIRGGANREVLKAIVGGGQIFEAWSDEPWVVDGAAVRVSIICFDALNGSEAVLDGNIVSEVFSDLTSTIDLVAANRLNENLRRSFQGPVKVGAFDVEGELARLWLKLPLNPNGLSNNVVLRPWANGMDVTRRPVGKWIIDFGMMSEADASLFEAPFTHVETNVRPERLRNKDRQRRENWWRLGRSGDDLKQATANLKRTIISPRVSKFRLFVWAPSRLLPDSAVVAIARDDDTTFGILHSKIHELWSLRMCTWLGVGNDPRYTSTTCFETFPFPEGLTPNIPAADYANDPRAVAIAKAAARINELRESWLNPPDLVKRIPEVVPGYPDRILPIDDAAAAILKKRTLTNLYNERPAWMEMAHKELDRAVAAAYGWTDWGQEGLPDDVILERLFKLNQERAEHQ
ncbi:MAG: class I SAM-dependent DNA methyltransferase [Hyphomicrobium sp.]|nr:class I SAM-dependent DNA methyltransferase [Hyphomicrobium sp.]